MVKTETHEFCSKSVNHGESQTFTKTKTPYVLLTALFPSLILGELPGFPLIPLVAAVMGD